MVLVGTHRVQMTLALELTLWLTHEAVVLEAKDINWTPVMVRNDIVGFRE